MKIKNFKPDTSTSSRLEKGNSYFNSISSEQNPNSLEGEKNAAKLSASDQEIIRTIFLCYYGFKEDFTDKLAKK